MARLFGIQIQDNNRIEYALTKVYGIGWKKAGIICKQANVDTHIKISKLKEEDLKKIISIVEKDYKIEGDLREEINENIKRLKEIGSYRGVRHIKGLPVHSQRTKSNSRTKKGKRKTVGALKKETWAKMEQAKTQAPSSKP